MKNVHSGIAGRRNTEAGFTLVELLVVIAIIGMLSSVTLASLTSTRIRSRDVQRSVAIKEIQKVLELYAVDNRHYPISSGHWSSFDAPAYVNGAITNPNAASLSAALEPYFSAPPKDPKRGTASDAGYLYISDSVGSDYCILFYKSPENMNNFTTDFIPMNRCGSIGSGGQCTGVNAIYIGTGVYASGC